MSVSMRHAWHGEPDITAVIMFSYYQYISRIWTFFMCVLIPVRCLGEIQ